MTAAPDAERIRTLIVDDELLARRTLRLLLEADPEVEIVGECSNGREAVAQLRQLKPELLLLDIQMPGMDGFEVLHQAGPESIPAIIFVTAHDTHALRAFEVHALDYLLKPFDDERFHRAVARAKAMVRQGRVHELTRRLVTMLGTPAGPPVTPPPAPPSGPAPAAPVPPSRGSEYLERIALKEGHRVMLLTVADIDWIEAEDYYAQIHAGGSSYLLREPLKELEAKLEPRQFVRIHRSTIVNVRRVKELQPLVHGESIVVLHDGTKLRLSRSRREHLHALLGLP